MKLFYLFIISLLSFQITFSQSSDERKVITSKYDFKKLKEIQYNFSKKYKEDKQNAIAYALQNNIDIIIPKENGGVSILEKVLKDGTLIYVSTYNAGSANTLNTDEVHSGGSLGLSLDGKGISFGIWDGGIVRNTHQELFGRVEQLDNPNSLSSHATHVSGTMIASGVNPNAKGMAFEAELKAYDFQNDLSEMAEEAMNGMLISNHSYGLTPSSIPESFFGAYISITSNLDDLVFNTPYYLPVFAAGNSRNVSFSQGGPFNPDKNGFDLISGKNLAKNILSVANVLEVNNYIGPSSVSIYESSSWGPTDDGRIKPDIAAKGTNTFSSTSNDDDTYSSFTGTSMATPSVSASIGLLHQHHNNLNNHFLNAASMRALVIHTAREAGEAPGPDYKFGWGLMDTAAAANVITNQDFTSIIEENTLNNEETYTFTVNAINADTPLVVTIAWTDPAGAIQDTSAADDTTPRLVNDLDLKIIAPDALTEILPWALDVSNPELAATKSGNSVDNVEKIEIDNAVGEYTIEVSHKGVLENSAQDYSIIVSGVVVSDFSIKAKESNQTFCTDESAILEFDVKTIDSFSGSINFTQLGLPESLNSIFSPASLNSQGSTFLTIDNLDAVESGNYPFTVTASSNGESFDFDMNLNIKSADEFEFIDTIHPADVDVFTSITPTLMWSDVPNADYYEVQLSEEQNFNTLLLSRQTQETEFETPELEPSRDYFWRVRAVNDCVTGPYSDSFFSVLSLECEEFTFAEDTPIDIESSGPNTKESIISITGLPDDRSVQDLNVKLELTHTYMADLIITLTSPAGTSITLLDQACGDLQNVNATFDDKGLAPSCNPDSPPALSGVIEAVDKLSTFKGENLNGDWTLTVEDLYNNDGGSIDRFGIELCYQETLSVNSSTLTEFKLYPNPSSGQVGIRFDRNLNQDIKIEILNLNGQCLKTFDVKTPANTFNFELNDLNSGVYLVKINTENSSTVKKLILQ